MRLSDQIKDLFATTEMSYQEIAAAVGCKDSYVRTVQQRMLGGGSSVGDRRYYEANREARNRRSNEISKAKYARDADYRERRRAEGRARYRVQKARAEPAMCAGVSQ